MNHEYVSARLNAFFLDVFLVLLGAFVFSAMIGALLAIPLILVKEIRILFVPLFIIANPHTMKIVFAWLYFALMESSAQQATIGKKMLKLKVTDEAGGRISFKRANARYWAKLLSAAPFFYGFITIITDTKHRALHDKLAGSRVISEKAVRSKAPIKEVTATKKQILFCILFSITLTALMAYLIIPWFFKKINIINHFVFLVGSAGNFWALYQGIVEGNRRRQRHIEKRKK